MLFASNAPFTTMNNKVVIIITGAKDINALIKYFLVNIPSPSSSMLNKNSPYLDEIIVATNIYEIDNERKIVLPFVPI